MYRVLVIQDRSPFVAPMCTVLEEVGLVAYHETPMQLFESGRWSDPVDLLILDLEPKEIPPNMRGWDILEMFMDFNHAGTEPAVVVMTESNEAPSRLLGNIHAVSAYLLKPVRTGELLSTVFQVLGLEGAPPVWG